MNRWKSVWEDSETFGIPLWQYANAPQHLGLYGNVTQDIRLATHYFTGSPTASSRSKTGHLCGNKVFAPGTGQGGRGHSRGFARRGIVSVPAECG